MATASQLTACRTELSEFADTATYPDAKIERFYDLALKIHGLVEEATIYCAAHLMVLTDDETEEPIDYGTRGQVSEQSVGAQSIKFADEGRDKYFGRTMYGRMFLMLEERATFATIRVV